MTNTIDCIMKNTLETDRNFISFKSHENIVCIGQWKKKIDQKEFYIKRTQNY